MSCLIKKFLSHKMNRILNEIHNIGSYVVNKLSLSFYDDERFILDDGINSLAYLIVCFYHVTYEFESESTLCSCLNIKELLAQSRCHI